MGLLDGILASLCNSSGLGGSSAQPGQSPLAGMLNSLGGGNQSQCASLLTAAAMSIFQQHGGLSGVLDKFRQNGMSQHVDSWVGKGPNMAISSEQVQQVFGDATIGNVASRLGQSHGQASSALAQVLPEFVNHLTPQGQVPTNVEDMLSQALGALRAGEAA